METVRINLGHSSNHKSYRLVSRFVETHRGYAKTIWGFLRDLSGNTLRLDRICILSTGCKDLKLRKCGHHNRDLHPSFVVGTQPPRVQGPKK